MTKEHPYEAPEQALSLSGPITRPAQGTLPIRGDLAHIALAGRFLVPHYAVPQIKHIGAEAVTLRLHANDTSEALAELAAGSRFELLDTAGAWCWGCIGPEGPSGWILSEALAPEAA